MTQTPTGNYLTPEGRVSFPVLKEPKPIGKNPKPGDAPKYQVTLLIDAEGQKTQDFKDLEAAVEQAIQDKWGKNRPRKVKSPFLTIDDLRNKIPAGYEEEHVFIRLNTEASPGVVKKLPNGELQRLEGHQVSQELYAGCNAICAVNVYAWTHDEGGAGVSLGLANVMKTGENEPFGAKNADAADDFGAPVTGGAAGDFMD